MSLKFRTSKKRRNKMCSISSLDELPFEILSGIFTNLSLPDRKRVRITCTRFYDACNIALILKREKLVLDYCKINKLIPKKNRNDFVKKIPLNYYFPFIIDALAECKRKYINLEVKHVTALECFLPFWQKCGSRIYHLHFYTCQINEDDLKNVVLYCKNLEQLSFTGCEINSKSDMDISNEFTEGREISQARKSVSSLRLVDVEPLSNYIFSKICVIFPHIKNISLDNFSYHFPHKVDLKNLETRISRSYPCILDREKVTTKSDEELNIEFKYSNSKFQYDYEFYELKRLLLHDFIVHPDIKLKQLNIRYDLFTTSSFITLIESQKFLEYIDVKCCYWFSGECLRELLKNCPKLRTLKMQSVGMILSCNDLEMLVTSQLESIQMKNIWVYEDKELPWDIKPNYQLIKLISSEYFTEDQVLWFIIKFPSVVSAKYFRLSYKVLNTITELQTNLKYLTIEECRFKRFEFVKILQFQNLETLELVRCEFSCIFKTLKLPCLKYLSIKSCSKMDVIHQDEISKNFPLLERLYIIDTEIPSYALVRILHGLKQLRILCVIDSDSKSLNEFKHLIFKYQNNTSSRMAVYEYSRGILKFVICYQMECKKFVLDKLQKRVTFLFRETY